MFSFRFPGYVLVTLELMALRNKTSYFRNTNFGKNDTFSLMQALNIIKNKSVFITWEAHKVPSTCFFWVREQKHHTAIGTVEFPPQQTRSPCFLISTQKTKVNTCLGITKLWLNFQEGLAAMIEPKPSSQESWCTSIRGGESVRDACGKECLQAQRGQRGCSKNGTGYLLVKAMWNQISCQRNYSKKQPKLNVSLNKTRPPWHFMQNWLMLMNQAIGTPKTEHSEGKAPKLTDCCEMETDLQEKAWVGNASLRCVFLWLLVPYVAPSLSLTQTLRHSWEQRKNNSSY